jgi:hypothetical protein
MSSMGVLSSARRQEKEYTDWKVKVKLYLFVDDMTTYVENSKKYRLQKKKTKPK